MHTMTSSSAFSEREQGAAHLIISKTPSLLRFTVSVSLSSTFCEPEALNSEKPTPPSWCHQLCLVDLVGITAQWPKVSKESRELLTKPSTLAGSRSKISLPGIVQEALPGLSLVSSTITHDHPPGATVVFGGTRMLCSICCSYQ